MGVTGGTTMILQRSERILDELTRRYQLDQQFIEKLRPVVWSILSPEIQEDKRAEILEFLAVTCERHTTIRKMATKKMTARKREPSDLNLLVNMDCFLTSWLSRRRLPRRPIAAELSRSALLG